MMLRAYIQDLISKLLAYLLRRRNVGLRLISLGAAIIALSMGFGYKFDFSLTAPNVFAKLFFTNSDGAPGDLVRNCFYVGCAICLIGLILIICDYIGDKLRNHRCELIVVELRGLVDTSDKPLIKSIPSHILGQRHDYHYDIRALMTTPNANIKGALNDLSKIRDDIRRSRGSRSREDVTIVVGGILHVPLQFYAGNLIDDEGKVILMDWDRVKKRWSLLNKIDDGERFFIEALPAKGQTIEVVLAISVSYSIDNEAINNSFHGLTVVSMSLKSPLPNKVWSENKQAELAQQFIDTVVQLGNSGVKTIHLLLAAPGSVVLRFGQHYDCRNMPIIRVYQYERKPIASYSWYVQLSPEETAVFYSK